MRKCRICKAPAKYLTPCNKAYCSADCGSVLAVQLLNKRKEAKAKEVDKVFRQRKLALRKEKPAWWVKNIQEKYFNPWIRIRDKDRPCISCGTFGDNTTQWDAGHYLSVGSSMELRFEPLNCHKQCRTCNRGNEQWSNRKNEVTKRYRVNLIDRVGLDVVEWLEGPHELKRYRVPELMELQEYWKQKLKEVSQ